MITSGLETIHITNAKAFYWLSYNLVVPFYDYSVNLFGNTAGSESCSKKQDVYDYICFGKAKSTMIMHFY